MDPHMEWMDDLGLFRIRCAKIVAGDARDRKSGHFGISHLGGMNRDFRGFAPLARHAV